MISILKVKPDFPDIMININQLGRLFVGFLFPSI